MDVFQNTQSVVAAPLGGPLPQFQAPLGKPSSTILEFPVFFDIIDVVFFIT